MRVSIDRSFRRNSSVRVLADEASPLGDPGRRALLQSVARYGALVPAVYLLAGRDNFIRPARSEPAAPHERGAGDDPISAAAQSEVRIVRDFADPYLELLRLLREATEIEHALMLQYLYGAFSLKPEYEKLAGYGDPNATTILGVAIQEMQHLAIVNRFLVALGAAPNVLPQDFPFEPEIYPFAFNLEPLSRATLAKYVYAEAPAGVLDWSVPQGEEAVFVNAIRSTLGPDAHVNHLGSLYSRIISSAREVREARMPGLPDMTPWIAQLEAVKDQGEEDHYKLFRSVFMGTHEAFNGRPNPWDLPQLDPGYPAMPLARNPSAYVGHERQIRNRTALSIAWLGNLHYWVVLCLLDLHFREQSAADLELARAHMLGPLWAVARYLPSLGAGMPFDTLATGYAPGLSAAWSRRFVLQLLGEADRMERKIGDQNALPDTFPTGVASATAETIRGELDQYHASVR